MKLLIKKNLKSLFALIALTATVGVVYGFTSPNREPVNAPQQKQNLQWHYIPNTAEGQNEPSNYELADGMESCPGTSSVRCIIEAPDNGQGQPDLDNATEVSFKF